MTRFATGICFSFLLGTGVMPAAGRKIVINALDNHNTLRLRSRPLGPRLPRLQWNEHAFPQPRVNPRIAKSPFDI